METHVAFHAGSGLMVPAVTADQMREVDRIAVEDFGLSILQMMENAGRNLALSVVDMLGSQVAWPEPALSESEGPSRRAEAIILAGSGGNGGGGLCCARHLHNRGFRVSVVLSRDAADLRGPAAKQLKIVRRAGLEPVGPSGAGEVLRGAQLVVDALVGYSLRGAPRGRVAQLIDLCNEDAPRVLSLDLPSGLDATTGETPGVVVRPERTLTLALPKTGLRSLSGELYLADIGIPPEVYAAVDVAFEWPFPERDWVRLEV